MRLTILGAKGDAGRFGAGFNDPGQRFSFKVRIALYRADQVGNEVGATIRINLNESKVPVSMAMQ